MMREGKVGILRLCTCLLAGALLLGCDNGASPSAQKKEVEQKSSADGRNATNGNDGDVAKVAVTIPAQDPAIIEKGEAAFNENCAPCHQADAIGSPGVAPSLTNPELLEVASDAFFIGTIRDGRVDTGMPPFEHLGNETIKSIVVFLRSHADRPNRSQEIDAEPAAHGDPRLGELWFKNICATCHGANGDGYASGGTGTAIGKPGFLDKASDGFIRATIKNGRSNTRMRGFRGPEALANLSDREIDDVIVYMRSLAKSQREASDQ